MISKQTIQNWCQIHDIKPTKLKGQHFLCDQGVLDFIIERANLKNDDVVVEVGPGPGVLTDLLVKDAGRVVAIELDNKLADILRAQYVNQKNLEIINEDALRVSLAGLGLIENSYRVIANIPYNITAPLIMKFIDPSHQAKKKIKEPIAEPRPSDLILMIQKEVAERLTAKPGEMSILAVVAQYFAAIELIKLVPRSVFWPEPNVDSALIHIKIKQDLPADDRYELFRLVRIGFAARRKQLRNTLASGLHRSPDEIGEIIAKLGLDPQVRAQELSVEDWRKMLQIV